MKYKEIVYMILDELKMTSDDSYYTEDHVKFLISKYRNQIIKQQYSDIKKEIPQSYYQCVTLNLEKTSSIKDMPCVGKTYLKSTAKIPVTLSVASPVIYPVDIMTGIEVIPVSFNKMRFVGNNKWLVNMMYVCRDTDNKLLMWSNNPQFEYLEKVNVYGVFENPEEAAASSCCSCEEGEEVCDIMDKDFPIEDALVPTLIQSVVKELLGAQYRPEDSNNNAADDLSQLANFLARNAKSEVTKSLEA